MQTTTVPPVDSAGLGIFALLASALATPMGKPAARRHQDAAPAAAPAPATGLLDRLDDWFWRIEQRAIERHLAKAQDIYDLECRIRDLERASIRRYE